VTEDELRARAVGSLFAPTTLAAALSAQGFVQADPIKAPATAQDLMLRQRVAGYRAGDLERLYPTLQLDEGYLYAYGFLTRELHALLHPTRAKGLTKIEQQVLEVVRERGRVHPKDLAVLGIRRRVNAWGGKSKATTMALDELQHRGLIRVVAREAGIRVYEPTAERPPGSKEGLRRLVLAIAHILAPAPEASLRRAVGALRRLGDPRAALKELVAEGALERHLVNGEAWVTPPRGLPEVPRVVRFLAPFDPVVWDRARFERLWGWAYRFEAYTPVPKRVRGYYALPLLWVDRVIGWVNAKVEDGELAVEPGFVGARPRGPEFRREYDAEVARFAQFLSR
jgi:uncharacterized protein YcaQ